MFKLPFGRKKSQGTDLPREVQDYYQAEKRERVGIAGLLALGTLVVTIVVAMGLFFGGRWVYQTVFNNDEPNATEQTADNGEDQQPEAEEEAAESEEEPASEPEPEPAQVATPAPAQTPPPSSTTPTTNGSLPNTGPADSLKVFVFTVALTSTAYYLAKEPQEA